MINPSIFSMYHRLQAEHVLCQIVLIRPFANLNRTRVAEVSMQLTFRDVKRKTLDVDDVCSFDCLRSTCSRLQSVYTCRFLNKKLHIFCQSIIFRQNDSLVQNQFVWASQVTSIKFKWKTCSEYETISHWRTCKGSCMSSGCVLCPEKAMEVPGRAMK